MSNNSKNAIQEREALASKKQLLQLTNNLLSYDDPKHLLLNFIDMYVVWNQSDNADCQFDRNNKSGTFLCLLDFLTGLSNKNKD